jgi:hypothetical protein
MLIVPDCVNEHYLKKEISNLPLTYKKSIAYCLKEAMQILKN